MPCTGLARTPLQFTLSSSGKLVNLRDEINLDAGKDPTTESRPLDVNFFASMVTAKARHEGGSTDALSYLLPGQPFHEGDYDSRRRHRRLQGTSNRRLQEMREGTPVEN